MTKLTKYQKEALRIDKHISLTANAGSGKTTVLSKRFVEILLQENILLSNIVAITFTEKAASELYTKIAKELDERITNSNSIIKVRLETIRRNLVSAKISTIHSFCIDILKDFAPEAGIDANFLPIDARTSDELLEQSIDEIIIKNLKDNNSEIKNLIRIFGNKSQLTQKIKQLFSKRKSTEKLVEKYYSKTVDNIAVWLNENFENKFKETFSILIDELILEIDEINSIAGKYKSTEIYIEVNRLLNELKSENKLIEKFIIIKNIADVIIKQDGNVRQQKYLSSDLYNENEILLNKISNNFAELKKIEIDENADELNFDLAKFGKIIIDFYNEVSDKYKFKKLHKSFLDFEDLLINTYHLVQNKDVVNKLSQKFKYIMVDEYQDTNEIQYEIFMPILQYLSSGNLFVVGDDKQSIYMFREAEVKVFNDTKKHIETKEGKHGILQLPHSFRLAPNIALFTNVLFSRIFKNPNPAFNEVEYNELVCAYSKQNKGRIDFLISEQEDGISEAELVAKKILHLVNDNKNEISFSDITVLCRVRKNFIELEKEFVKYNLPFTIVGGKGFFQQQLVLDVYNYLSFLINTKNDLAFLSILRSPYFGITDTEIAEISFEKGAFYFEKFKNYINSKSKFKNIFTLLEHHIKLSSKTEISELIRIINNETAYWAYLSNKKNGKQDIANLEKLILQAINITEQGFNTLYDFTNYLKDAINNLEDEGHAELDETENSIKIMTIHQSKGLEFKVVILFKTNQKNFDETLKTKDIYIDKDFGILSKLPFRKNYFENFRQAPIIGLYNYFQNKKSIAELKRLLYVAITRSEEYLIVSMQTKKGSFSKDSFAEIIAETLNIDLNKSEKVISGNLTFMKLNNEVYETKVEKVDTIINLIKSIELENTQQIIEEKAIDESYEFLIEKIKSTEKNEIISASKISLFLQCPKKYQLTYEFGYGELIKLFRNNDEYEFNQKEDENIPANILGKIVHSILNKETYKKDLIAEIENEIQLEDELILIDSDSKQKLVKEIVELFDQYYSSESYRKILNFKKFQNEIEIYKREQDYFLYGIIDKLIIENDKIIIIDFKTDKISNKNINEKLETYFNQLKFYSYILASKYSEIENYELILVFIREDNFTSSINLSKKEIQNFGKVISESVYKIRTKQFDEVTKGCEDMKFYKLEECSH
ncbi:MAG: UvrD-helicase domain-containing protein [Ignavibacteriae bacterium]|nr:UvrD-helicase domain-containing protein [Ignavibacteriota bacterium]